MELLNFVITFLISLAVWIGLHIFFDFVDYFSVKWGHPPSLQWWEKGHRYLSNLGCYMIILVVVSGGLVTYYPLGNVALNLVLWVLIPASLCFLLMWKVDAWIARLTHRWWPIPAPKALPN